MGALPLILIQGQIMDDTYLLKQMLPAWGSGVVYDKSHRAKFLR